MEPLANPTPATTTGGKLLGATTQRGVIRAAVALLIGMVIVSVLLTMGAEKKGAGGGVGLGATAFLLFTAATAVGAGLGFLFGLPRARLADLTTAADLTTQQQLGASDPGGSTPKVSASTHYLTNSNL